MPLLELSKILWHERKLVDGEIGEQSRMELYLTELTRAMVVNTLVQTLDLDDEVTLRELAECLPAPWDDVFGAHHAALSVGGRAEALPRSLAEFLG